MGKLKSMADVSPEWITPGDVSSHVVLHVPHSSRRIPVDVRDGILLTDHALSTELDAMTDRHTAELAEAIASAMSVRPWLAVNPWSRLVVDPERFLDDREEMNQVGMGAVYLKTSDGADLRSPDPARDALLIDQFFRPYASALSSLTTTLLERHARVLVLDIHSYPENPLPYELHKNEQRPEVCLGVDDWHTPARLVADVTAALKGVVSVCVNEPFHGCYIPDPYFGVESRVQGIMLELRRDVGDRPGTLSVLADRWAEVLEDFTAIR